MAPISLPLRRSTAANTANEPPDLSELVAQLGSEVASALSTALERVNALATTGRIDRPGLRALREEIELARLIGMTAQQLSRLASGRVRQAPEPLDLTSMLREALLQRGREIEARGFELRQRLRPACVIGDATLTYSLLQALLDWAFEHAHSRIEITIDHRTWPERAVLTCRFANRPADEAPGTSPGQQRQALETMSWRLLHQTAATLGLPIEREDGPGDTEVAIEFPRTIGESPPGVATLALAAPDGPPANPRSLVGVHVLVVAARREVRQLVREALRPAGLMLDFVTSIDEAREFCRGGMPHALVHEAALGGEGFERLRRELLAEVPRLAFIQISEEGKGFEVRRQGHREIATVARAAVVDSLTSALVFELSRQA